MKTIKIKFTDFWKGFNPATSIFLHHLNKHFHVILSDHPDYIIYSVFGNEYMKHDCIRIFYTCENIRPDFNLCDYALAFDWMDFEDRYFRFPVYMFNLYNYDMERASIKHEISEEELIKKQKFCNFIYSNHKAVAVRRKFFDLLNSYKRVDSGGKYLNNLGYCVKNKFEFQVDYKFSIAFENSSASGYTTEKITQAFAAKTIPIYWGNPNIGKEFNTDSFINCHDYACFSDVLNRVIEVDEDDDLYLKILKTPIYENINLENIPNMTSFGDFLNNIFDQDINIASRRSKNIRSAAYEKLRFIMLHSRLFMLI